MTNKIHKEVSGQSRPGRVRPSSAGVKTYRIPPEVVFVTKTLKNKGFLAYPVGGCVRDLLIGRKPKDWDVTTNAKPEEIVKIFPDTFYENEFGTVGVVSEHPTDETLKVVEVTPFRLEGPYSDGRRPDTVEWSGKLEDDLSRRDFTVNAIALDVQGETGEGAGPAATYHGTVIDLHGGRDDLRDEVIRSVGEPDRRFGEDFLRILRGIRLVSELRFSIEKHTLEEMKKNASGLKKIAKERVRDEFLRIIMSDSPEVGLRLAHSLSVLPHILPELMAGAGIAQNKAHSYDVFEHTLKTLQYGAKKGFPLVVRLSALFHDLGKPATRRWSAEKKDWTFYGHDVVGERISKTALQRLRFPSDVIEKVTRLVRWHMFFSDTEVITHAAVRRLLMNVGKENVWDLMDLRVCDRIGTGRPKESPYRLRKYKAMIEEVMRDPISVSMLKIKGGRIMEITGLEAGPAIGHILHALLEEVLDDPKKNTSEYLEEKALELSQLSQKELLELGQRGKSKRIGEEEKIVKEIRGKYWVK